MVQFSQLVVEQRWIQELDINPLLASPEQLIALDARVLLYPAETPEADLPKLAIRPYPSQYVSEWQLQDGTPITIQPIRPEDEALLVEFHKTLSEESVYNRYFQMMPYSRRVAHERLSRLSFIDYDREMALVAKHRHPETGQMEIIGVGRLVKLVGTGEAEFAVIIGDPWQGQGLGARLLELLIEVGRAEEVRHIIGTVLPENRGMLNLIKKLGFEVQRSYEDRVVEARYDLSKHE
jgi:acetyltransferase